MAHILLRTARLAAHPFLRSATSTIRQIPASCTHIPHVPSQRLLLPASLHTSCRRLNEYIINIQDNEDFKVKVLESKTPVVVDFHAGWCGPCKLLGPRLESMISSQDGKVILAKVDIDENSDLAIDHGVQAVPTVLAVKDGKVVDKFVGLKDDDALDSFIAKLTG